MKVCVTFSITDTSKHLFLLLTFTFHSKSKLENSDLHLQKVNFVLGMEVNVSSYSSELVTSLNFQNISESSLDENSAVVNKHTRTYEYITYKDAKENLSKLSEHHLNEKKFLDQSDGETQSFIVSVQKELDQHIPQESVEYIKLRGRKCKSFCAWVLLKKDAMPLKIDASFLGKAANPKVTAVTLLNSSEEVRGLRISLKESKARLYEIINGRYDIQFNWKISRHEDCSIVASISSGGTVTYEKPSKDFTFEDLKKHDAVTVRIGNVNNKEMTLAEVISSGKPLCTSSGEI